MRVHGKGRWFVRMVEDIGRTREQQPERVRQERGRRGAITAQVYFHRLDIVFAIPRAQ